jgi:hypothetical protein
MRHIGRRSPEKLEVCDPQVDHILAGLHLWIQTDTNRFNLPRNFLHFPPLARGLHSSRLCTETYCLSVKHSCKSLYLPSKGTPAQNLNRERITGQNMCTQTRRKSGRFESQAGRSLFRKQSQSASVDRRRTWSSGRCSSSGSCSTLRPIFRPTSQTKMSRRESVFFFSPLLSDCLHSIPPPLVMP